MKGINTYFLIHAGNHSTQKKVMTYILSKIKHKQKYINMNDDDMMFYFI
jgi:hypothetical protein